MVCGESMLALSVTRSARTSSALLVNETHGSRWADSTPTRASAAAPALVDRLGLLPDSCP